LNLQGEAPALKLKSCGAPPFAKKPLLLAISKPGPSLHQFFFFAF
jgi:hypothetical protein